MTFPLVPPANGVDKGYEGDERTRTAASVPTSESDKALQPGFALDGSRRCVSCPAIATFAMRLASGRAAHLCEPCLAKYPRPSIYFLRGGRLVKIGFSVDVPRRLRNHQISSPLPLVLWHIVEGTQELEHELHRRFAADHSHGEWFRISDAIRDYIAGQAA